MRMVPCLRRKQRARGKIECKEKKRKTRKERKGKGRKTQENEKGVLGVCGSRKWMGNGWIGIKEMSQVKWVYFQPQPNAHF